MVDAYLEAEDAEEQQQILAHPEHIIWYQWDLPEDPYDGRLSDYGNELMHAIMHLCQPIDILLTTLIDSRISGLTKDEKENISPFLKELCDLSGKLSATVKVLQIK